MLLEAKADVNIKNNVSHAACMVVFVYSADSMVECVYCHLCVWVDWVVESVQLAGPVAVIYNYMVYGL